MTKITEHFVLAEFNCKDGTVYPESLIDTHLKPLCVALEVIREAIDNKPIHIISGFRTATHNIKVGGSTESQHLYGKAADLMTRHLSPKKLYKVISKLIREKKIPEGGLGVYRSHVHYDIRGNKARWGWLRFLP